jgi:hypothetical protein
VASSSCQLFSWIRVFPGHDPITHTHPVQTCLKEGQQFAVEVLVVDVALDELAEEGLQRVLLEVLRLVLQDLLQPLALLARLASLDEVLQEDGHAHL